MNRSPARLKIVRPCDCASRYAECNCAALAAQPHRVIGRVLLLSEIALIIVFGVAVDYFFG